MPGQLIRGVILEGGSTAGKTSVLRAIKQLNATADDGERSIVALGEHYSQVQHAVHGEFVTLTRDEHLQLLEQKVTFLEHLQEWGRWLGPASRRSRGVLFVLERFHLNHRLAFPEADHSRIAQIEQRLAALGAVCVLLTLSPSAVEQRYVFSRGKEWERQALQSHASVADACAAYCRAQESLRALALQAAVPTLEVNTDAAAWNLYAKQILDRLDAGRAPRSGSPP